VISHHHLSSTVSLPLLLPYSPCFRVDQPPIRLRSSLTDCTVRSSLSTPRSPRFHLAFLNSFFFSSPFFLSTHSLNSSLFSTLPGISSPQILLKHHHPTTGFTCNAVCAIVEPLWRHCYAYLPILHRYQNYNYQRRKSLISCPSCLQTLLPLLPTVTTTTAKCIHATDEDPSLRPL